jgi:Metallo-beta-lactamase superfamily
VLALRAVQAEFGDCLIVEFGSAGEPRYLLVDGGPPGTYVRDLEPELRRIAAGGRIELAVLSHVDNDHVSGLLDLLTQLREQRANHQPETIAIEGFWHNSFARAIDPAGELGPRMRALVAAAGGPQAMGQTGIAVEGIAEGDKLRQTALLLGLPINQGFAGELVCVDDAPALVTLENLTLRVVGPTRANLAELEQDWRKWLDAHEDAVADGDPLVASMADRSVPNLSSIMVLAEADGKRVLLTGDGRGDHLLDGLRTAGVLSADGSIHVDVLKVAHHGSDRNATRDFFEAVTADTYVVSANGKYGNPDLATLIWIVEAARKQGRGIDLVLTNPTPSSEKLLHEYPPGQYGYQLTTMAADKTSLVVELSPP